MSVLIKDMQIPDNCDVCLFADWSNLHQTSCCKLKEYEPGFQDYSIAYRTQRSTICPLVELPEKYGRLFDSDEVKKVLDDLPDSEDKWTAIALLEWAIEKRWCIEAEGA